MKILKTIAISSLVIFLVGFGIGSGSVVPGYALAYLDDVSKTYFTLPCVDEWQNRKVKASSLLRLDTVGGAGRAGYKADEKCREQGGLVAEGRSLSGIMLEKVGILRPTKFWWDAPYRTEDGSLVYPTSSKRDQPD